MIDFAREPVYRVSLKHVSARRTYLYLCFCLAIGLSYLGWARVGGEVQQDDSSVDANWRCIDIRLFCVPGRLLRHYLRIATYHMDVNVEDIRGRAVGQATSRTMCSG